MTRPDQREGEELARALQEPAPVPEVEAALGAGHPALEQVASLQRSAGNQAVARMLEQTRKPPPARPGLGTLPRRGSMLARDIAPGAHAGALGSMDIKMIAKNDAATGGRTGLDGSVTFTPDPKSPYSSKIGLIQLVKLTDEKGTDINAASMPATSAPQPAHQGGQGRRGRGAASSPTCCTRTSARRGNPVAPKGGNQTHYYQGGAPQFGFRRSEKADDIKAAQLTDFPSTTDKDSKLNFAFETVAKGDDNQVVYGSVKWAFNIRGGKVQDETHSFADGASATFDAAMERHRDFYVHEPVTIYYDFDADAPSAGEDAKFANLIPYLTKFPDVHDPRRGLRRPARRGDLQPRARAPPRTGGARRARGARRRHVAARRAGRHRHHDVVRRRRDHARRTRRPTAVRTGA